MLIIKLINRITNNLDLRRSVEKRKLFTKSLQEKVTHEKTYREIQSNLEG